MKLIFHKRYLRNYHSHLFVCKNNWFYVLRYALRIRFLLRLEFQVAHPILMKTLATDQKWPFSHFHISYQKSKISWQKMGTILVKSALNALKLKFSKNVIFDHWPKLSLGLDMRPEIPILKVIYYLRTFLVIMGLFIEKWMKEYL